MKHDANKTLPGSRDTALLAESLERAAVLEAACETYRLERDVAVAAAVRGQERLARHRLVRAALCLSVATSGALLMRVSTLPPPVRAAAVAPTRRAVARPAPAPSPDVTPALLPAVPRAEDTVWVGEIGGVVRPPERVRALPVVQRPEP